MNNDVEKVLYTQDQVNQRLDELANTLTEKYQGKFPVLVSVMTGAMIFSSYEESSESTGKVKLIQDLSHDIKDRPVLIMEDIIDTGHTLKYLVALFANRGAKSIEICSLLDKPDRREVDVEADYVGFKVPNEFIVGYGLDFDGLYRNLPYVGVLKRSVYEK